MLFNPALIDLTALPADFLSARPNLLTAFDKLWDNQIMPETKICALEGKACHFGRGSNREDLHRNLEFTLRCNISDFWASAPRWRIGILVEDLIAEVSMSRRFTAELELHRELLNNLDGAIAIFSISGELYHQNEAHAQLWGSLSTDPENRSTIQDASKLWQSRSKPTGLWGEIRDFVNQIDEREGWIEDIIYENEHRISVQIVPLMGQHTAVCFTY